MCVLAGATRYENCTSADALKCLAQTECNQPRCIACFHGDRGDELLCDTCYDTCGKCSPYVRHCHLKSKSCDSSALEACRLQFSLDSQQIETNFSKNESIIRSDKNGINGCSSTQGCNVSVTLKRGDTPFGRSVKQKALCKAADAFATCLSTCAASSTLSLRIQYETALKHSNEQCANQYTAFVQAPRMFCNAYPGRCESSDKQTTICYSAEEPNCPAGFECVACRSNLRSCPPMKDGDTAPAQNGLCVPCPSGKLCNVRGIVNPFGESVINQCPEGVICSPTFWVPSRPLIATVPGGLSISNSSRERRFCAGGTAFTCVSQCEGCLRSELCSSALGRCFKVCEPCGFCLPFRNCLSLRQGIGTSPQYCPAGTHAQTHARTDACTRTRMHSQVTCVTPQHMTTRVQLVAITCACLSCACACMMNVCCGARKLNIYEL